MNYNTFKSKIKTICNIIKKNPKKLLLIFNFLKVLRVFKQFKNADLPFEHLNINYQKKVLFETYKKINELFSIYKIQNDLIKINNISELEKKYSNNIDYQNLASLFNKYGSDKVRTYLSYIYFEIFDNYKINSLLEIGLGSNNLKIRSNMGIGGKPGASLRAFRDYLKIQIYGADLDKQILFKEDKISTFYVDQLNAITIKDLKNNLPKLDLIIDDGLHQPDANLNIIIELIDHLNPGGILVIEDIELVFNEIFEVIKNIFQKVYNFKSSLVKMKNGYCLLIQKN
jgi:SAM-dependent methyltransferase